MSEKLCPCCGNRVGCDCYSPQSPQFRRIAELKAALKAIAEHRGRCIYSNAGAFRDGSHAAFLEVAEIADAAIDAARKDGA